MNFHGDGEKCISNYGSSPHLHLKHKVPDLSNKMAAGIFQIERDGHIFGHQKRVFRQGSTHFKISLWGFLSFFPDAGIFHTHKTFPYEVRYLTVTIISILMFWQEVYKGKIDCSTSNSYYMRMHVVFSFNFGVFLGEDMFLKQILTHEISPKVECSQGG